VGNTAGTPVAACNSLLATPSLLLLLLHLSSVGAVLTLVSKSASMMRVAERRSRAKFMSGLHSSSSSSSSSSAT
jgi:hypothetical protein